MVNLGGRGYPEPSSADAWESLGFPPALAKARAESAFTTPRRAETTRAFETLVRDVFVPPLKHSGFAKTRNVWRRQHGSLRNLIDIQRSHATGDLLRFTSNWSMLVPGFEFEFRRDVVFGGRIGDFIDSGLDRWWSIQLGWLAADFPEITDDSEQCRQDIASGLDRMIRSLDEIDSVATLIKTLERRDPIPFRFHDQGTLQGLVAALGRFRDAP